MDKIYSNYKCINCRKEFILLTDEVQESENKNRFISCPFCSSKKIKKTKDTDSLKECMKERSYQRVNGAIRQK